MCTYVVLLASPMIEGAHLVVTCKLCSAKTTYSELRFDHIALNMCKIEVATVCVQFISPK